MFIAVMPSKQKWSTQLLALHLASLLGLFVSMVMLPCGSVGKINKLVAGEEVQNGDHVNQEELVPWTTASMRISGMN